MLGGQLAQDCPLEVIELCAEIWVLDSIGCSRLRSRWCRQKDAVDLCQMQWFKDHAFLAEWLALPVALFCGRPPELGQEASGNRYHKRLILPRVPSFACRCIQSWDASRHQSLGSGDSLFPPRVFGLSQKVASGMT